MDVELARERLQNLLSDLDRTIETLRGERPSDNFEELSAYDQHPADSGSNLYDADRASALLEASERQRGQVRDALERIENGTYGLCVDCGRQLAEERLEARPEAARCVEDQAKFEGVG